MDKLPAEVLEHLLLYVNNPHDLFNLRAVFKRWHALITNEYFLTRYFDNRFGRQSKQSLEWDVRRTGYTHLKINRHASKRRFCFEHHSCSPVFTKLSKKSPSILLNHPADKLNVCLLCINLDGAIRLVPITTSNIQLRRS